MYAERVLMSGIMRDGRSRPLSLWQKKTMAQFERMIPFICHFAAGVYGKDGDKLRLSYEEVFRVACKTGWSDDPDDPGGATMVDVTLATYRDYCRRKGLGRPGKRELRCISFQEWSEILKSMYWDRWQADMIESQGVANMLVDWMWGSGVVSIRKAQRLIGVTADGIVGDKTLSAIVEMDSGILFRRLYEARKAHFHSCRGAWKYLAGWMRRLDALMPDGSFLIYGRYF